MSFCFFTLEATEAQVRSLDGSGNNAGNPDWGSAGSQLLRIADPAYADGVSAPSGADRPNPRDVSNAVSHQTGPMFSAYSLSDFTWQWGQFIDHDMDLSIANGTPLPIAVLDGSDPLFPMIPLNRTQHDPSTGTSAINPRQQINSISSYLDASMVYGSDAGRASVLAEGAGGRMKMTAAGLLPLNAFGLDNANGAPILNDEDLFVAGDVRVNEQVGLTAMHTLFVREHNRLADEIATANPTWTNDQIYQKARSIVMGEVQAVTYQEFLPALMGSSSPGLYDGGYSSSVDASIANEFASVFFRLGHTMVSPQILKVDDSGTTIDVLNMSDSFFVSPLLIDESSDVDFILKGLATQVQQELDVKVIDDLRNRLFGPPGAGGLDLVSLNLQRGRDHGLPDYNTLRNAYGLAMVSDFSEITSDVDVAFALQTIYDNDISLVDPWIGALAEDHLAGSSLGELLDAALADQFTRLRDGDSFFFLRDPGLTEDERNMIANRRLSDIILDNSPALTGIQSNVFYASAPIPEPSRAVLLSLAIGCAALLRRRRATGG